MTLAMTKSFQMMKMILHFVENKSDSGVYQYFLYYAYPLNDHEQDGYELTYLGECTE